MAARATTTDMRRLFGGATGDVNFNPIPGLENKVLPLPAKGDSLAELADKMDALRKVVEHHHSLAVATGMQAAAHKTIDPREHAMQEMGVVEKEQYLAWEAGARLSDFDPATSREPRSKWNGGDVSLARWVKGLKAMYSNDQLNEEHAVWFAVHASFMVPTITAYVKILNAGRGMVDEEGKLLPEEMAEYQTSRRILADAAFQVQEIKKVINDYTARIGRAEDVVLARIRYYQRRVGEKPKPEAPENRNRRKRGLPTFGAPNDLGSMVGGGREARRRRIDLGTGGGDVASGDPAITRMRSPEYAPQSPRLAGDDGDTAMPSIETVTGNIRA